MFSWTQPLINIEAMPLLNGPHNVFCPGIWYDRLRPCCYKGMSILLISSQTDWRDFTKYTTGMWLVAWWRETRKVDMWSNSGISDYFNVGHHRDIGSRGDAFRILDHLFSYSLFKVSMVWSAKLSLGTTLFFCVCILSSPLIRDQFIPFQNRYLPICMFVLELSCTDLILWTSRY